MPAYRLCRCDVVSTLPKMLITYRYGARAPESWTEAAATVMTRRSAFWNALVRIDAAAAASYRALLHRVDPSLESLESRVIHFKRLQRNGDAYSVPDLRAASTLLSERRKSAKHTALAELDRLREQEKASIKAARQQSGLWWHHYQDVLLTFRSATAQARKAAAPPRERAIDDDYQSFSLSFPDGLPVDAFLKGDSRILTIDRAIIGNQHARSAARCILSIAIDRAEDGSYQSVSIPVQWHRPLPASAFIKNVRVSRRPIGGKYRWSVAFLLDKPPPTDISIKSGVCGVDFGWRMTDRGLRVAYWVDDNGGEGELLLPPEWIEKARRHDDLRRLVQERSVGAAQAILASPPPENIEVHALLRELSDRRQHPTRTLLSLYPSRDHLAPEARQSMDAWHCETHRDINEVAGLGERLKNRRIEIYRQFARTLWDTNRHIVIEALDLRRLRQLQARTVPFAVRRCQGWASLSLLRQWLEHYARQASGVLEARLAMDSTLTCHLCGHLNSGSTIEQTVICARCNSAWDQDANAAINLRNSAAPSKTSNAV